MMEGFLVALTLRAMGTATFRAGPRGTIYGPSRSSLRRPRSSSRSLSVERPKSDPARKRKAPATAPGDTGQRIPRLRPILTRRLGPNLIIEYLAYSGSPSGGQEA